MSTMSETENETDTKKKNRKEKALLHTKVISMNKMLYVKRILLQQNDAEIGIQLTK